MFLLLACHPPRRIIFPVWERSALVLMPRSPPLTKPCNISVLFVLIIRTIPKQHRPAPLKIHGYGQPSFHSDLLQTYDSIFIRIWIKLSSTIPWLWNQIYSLPLLTRSTEHSPRVTCAIIGMSWLARPPSYKRLQRGYQFFFIRMGSRHTEKLRSLGRGALMALTHLPKGS